MSLIRDDYAYLGAQLLKQLNLPDNVVEMTLHFKGGHVPVVSCVLHVPTEEASFGIADSLVEYELRKKA